MLERNKLKAQTMAEASSNPPRKTKRSLDELLDLIAQTEELLKIKFGEGVISVRITVDTDEEVFE